MILDVRRTAIITGTQRSGNMTIDDIVTKDGIDKEFMSWLWNKDRKKHTYILFGHIELITNDLIKEFVESEVEDGNID